MTRALNNHNRYILVVTKGVATTEQQAIAAILTIAVTSMSTINNSSSWSVESGNTGDQDIVVLTSNCSTISGNVKIPHGF